MTLDNKPPYAWEGGPEIGSSFMSPDPAPQGGMVTANWRLLEVNRLCPATLQRIFIDHATGATITTLDTTEASRSVNLHDQRLPRSFQLPSNLPPVTDYQTLVCFECNAYQRLVSPLCIMTPKITFRVQ
ncbi:hypothetical protein FNL55_12775 [Tardiphaga sp. vice352]|uniref:hypothetical protein n=1 Tax=Tardiphaga sp. vice352 TaxID=2592816 RepID=UPI0011648EEC|nr:hypothetical protein [Tardiphaga sp. vice352]QDM32113.1 hypothetical protein FNL55_12775 [Tardiphaga sp. vice352]